MKVIEHIENAKNKEPLFSYEIVPPPRGRSAQDIIDVVEKLSEFNPPWIDVTSHSSTRTVMESPQGQVKIRTLRKRPGTLGICGIIQNRFRIDTVAHILCLGFSKEETEDALIELNFLGIHNVLALRGDIPNFSKVNRPDRTMNNQAEDLVRQIMELNQGHFLDDDNINCDKFNFCVGVAGYPEKHFESPSLKQDINYLKRKVEAGAEYIVTQMFFDNQKYFDFVKQCRAEGINVPIIPGLKVLRSAAQLRSLPKNFYIDLPDELVDSINNNPEHAAEIGKAWSLKQAQELLDAKVPSLHFYVLNDVDMVAQIVHQLKKI